VEREGDRRVVSKEIRKLTAPKEMFFIAKMPPEIIRSSARKVIRLVEIT